MGSIPFALSIHHFINTVGSDAGFASIIGLAILVLLYFAQARETATLREHAADAAARIQQLEARVAHLLSRPPAQAPPAQAPVIARPGAAAAAAAAAAGGIVASRGPRTAAAQAGVGAPGGTAVLAPPAFAPAGVGAPALTAATKLIPTPVPSPPAPEPGAAPALAPYEAEPVPATVGGNGHSHAFDTGPVPVAAPEGPPPRVQIRPGQTAAGPPRRPGAQPRFTEPPSDSSPVRRIIAAIVGALVVAGIVVALLVVTSGGGGSKPKSGAVRNSNASVRTRHQALAVNPADVTVAVLNGTATTGLAHRVATQLGTAGYKLGTSGNAPDQTHTATIVGYLPGFRADATAVARALKLKVAAVQAVDTDTQAVACPGAPAPCTANVVVTVGADLSQTP
jgi:LytR cell envelope-related transcriptional attenuator